MPELRVRDYKPDPLGRWSFATVKKGYSLYGEIRRYPGGLTVYWAFRKPDEVFVEMDAWAFDTETVAMLKMRKVPLVGVEVSNGDRYLTRVEHIEDKDLGCKVLNYSGHISARGRYGARQWYVPRYLFAKRLAEPEGTIALMSIKPTRAKKAKST